MNDPRANVMTRCFSVIGLARYWRRRPSAIRALVRSGELESFVSGSRVRISPAAVEEYERQHTAATPKKVRRRETKSPDYVTYYE